MTELKKSGEHALKAPVKHAKKAAKKHAKKAVKQATKHAAKRHAAKKTASLAEEREGLRTAFHHMQRASVVISLMEKGTGEDLRALLARGIALYKTAASGKGGLQTVLQAIGVLRAAEHLSLAGLYEARRRYRQKVEEPKPESLLEFLHEAHHRLEHVAAEERSKGEDLRPVTEELLLQAEEQEDPQLAFELAMAADALCFALENGL